jgi:hypothetical protein
LLKLSDVKKFLMETYAREEVVERILKNKGILPKDSEPSSGQDELKQSLRSMYKQT